MEHKCYKINENDYIITMHDNGRYITCTHFEYDHNEAHLSRGDIFLANYIQVKFKEITLAEFKQAWNSFNEAADKIYKDAIKAAEGEL